MSESKTLVVAPLQHELKFLAQAFGLKHQSEELLLNERRVHYFPTLNTYLALCGHGKSQAAVQTGYWLQELAGVKQVICAGACGALSEKLNTGDIVVAEETVEHDYHQKFTAQKPPRFKASEEMLVKLKQVASKNVYFGAMASGDEDIIEHKRAAEILGKTRAIAVAWEGAGVARAAAYYKKSFVEVRAVTDHAGSAAIIEFKKNLETSVLNLGEFILKHLQQ